jgi:hypothetical protein
MTTDSSLDDIARRLRQRLHMVPDAAKVAKLRKRLNLSLSESVVLAALHEAGCAWVPADKLVLALPKTIRDKPGVLPILVDCLRVMLGEYAVLYYCDVGYTLGAPGVIACRKALEGGA